MTFYECKNLRVADLIIQNAQQMHLSFQKCVNVKVLNLLVSAPEKSPNTDGIHVTGTQNILIKNCVIRTGNSQESTLCIPCLLKANQILYV